MNTIVTQEHMNLVKKHIKNLIQGHAIGRDELITILKEEIIDLAKQRINQAFGSFSTENFIQQAVRKEINLAIGKLLPNNYYSKNEYFERLVKDEVNRQVTEILANKFVVTINEQQAFKGEDK